MSRSTSSGPDAAGKVTWEGDMTGMGQTFKTRGYEEPGTKKNSVHMWGEVSMDGKTYNKMYDITCKK